jgi:hypothetical protein
MQKNQQGTVLLQIREMGIGFGIQIYFYTDPDRLARISHLKIRILVKKE